MDQSLVLWLGLLAVVAAMAITLVDMAGALKPASCPECGHCRAVAQAAAIEQERVNREYARRLGLEDDEDDRPLR
jgi:hypothetical protein